MSKTLARVVVEIDMSELQIIRQSCLVDCKTMVLTGDLDFAGREILDGLVASAMPKLEFVGAGAKGERKQLMAQADTKSRQSCLDDQSQLLHDILACGRISGPIGEE